MTVDQLLSEARSRIDRLTPQQADAEHRLGSLLVDIRPEAQRRAEGEVPGAVIVERNVLEWRLDPASPWRLPVVTGPQVRPIVLCSQGYTSSLAAAALVELGLAAAADVDGGFQAWQAAGLPTRPGGSPAVP